MNTAEHSDSDEAIRLIDLPAVRAQTGLSKSSIYTMIESGRFPRPIQATKRARRWVASEVSGWIRERMAER